MQELCRVQRRLNKAYLLQESFGQRWGYVPAGWTRRFFNQWRESLRGQRRKPCEKFATWVDAPGDGIAAYGPEENKVALGFVAGLTNQVRALQRRAYGCRDEEYFRLKILTCMLPKL